MNLPRPRRAKHPVLLQVGVTCCEATNCRGTLKVPISWLCLAASPCGPIASLLMHCPHSLQVVLREALSWRPCRVCRVSRHERFMYLLIQGSAKQRCSSNAHATARTLPMPSWLQSVIAAPVSVYTACSALTCQEEGVVSIPGWVLLGLEQCIKVPEAAQERRNRNEAAKSGPARCITTKWLAAWRCSWLQRRIKAAPVLGEFLPALHIVVGRHFLKAHGNKNLAELCAHLQGRMHRQDVQKAACCLTLTGLTESKR